MGIWEKVSSFLVNIHQISKENHITLAKERGVELPIRTLSDRLELRLYSWWDDSLKGSEDTSTLIT